MPNQPSRHYGTHSPCNDITAGGNPFDSTAGYKQEPWNQPPGKEHDDRLARLQQFICELLIKNQELRWLLESSTNHRYQVPADDQTEDVARV